MTIAHDTLACPQCNTSDQLVMVGISPIVEIDEGKLAWVIACWNCPSQPRYYINDAARDSLFGTGWRTNG